VHKARLADGRQVAVKVQYPGLRGAANADLTTLSCLSAAAAALFPEFRLSWLYEELRLKLTEELGEWGLGCVTHCLCPLS
jgi:aarF domain-containing kinase